MQNTEILTFTDRKMIRRFKDAGFQVGEHRAIGRENWTVIDGRAVETYFIASKPKTRALGKSNNRSKGA